jgi:putative tricarboxylic transport membrane protein
LFLQSGALKLFVLITKVRMYVLASIILAYCGIGIFALNNVAFDMWTLFWFGILGYVMRNLGFPLAPMILGVVLGRIAELWLSRATAITTDITPFFTHPWSLFFIILALFSMFFSSYQTQRGRKAWTIFYTPALIAFLSIPMFMMVGTVRPMLGGVLLVIAVIMVFRSYKRGWKVDPTDADDHRLTEG